MTLMSHPRDTEGRHPKNHSLLLASTTAHTFWVGEVNNSNLFRLSFFSHHLFMNYIFDLILNISPDLYEAIRSYFAFWLERFSSNNWLIGILLLFPLFIIVTFITGLFWVIMVAMGLAAISFSK